MAEEIPSSSQPSVSDADAYQHLDGALTWLRSLPDATPGSVATLVQLREIAAQRRDASLVQSKISSFFSIQKNPTQ